MWKDSFQFPLHYGKIYRTNSEKYSVTALIMDLLDGVPTFENRISEYYKHQNNEVIYQ